MLSLVEYRLEATVDWLLAIPTGLSLDIGASIVRLMIFRDPEEEVEEKGIVNRRTASKWFKRFREGTISLEDKPRMGRPLVTDIETLRFMVMNNPQQSTREMSARLGPSKYTINRTLYKLNFVIKPPRHDPHNLTIVQS
ncbi:hypothetical protein LAZ67_11002517 [Cordylochernes scorpioides]|uniref:Transposase n=1 Tax=Cordylochernes scorpioides TaxID=51811 RepID=A0ABY6L219_9ARAC|nr:hypothetical protein LAZ67_11002517 [Cordylochernes scorpioides]